MTKNQWHLLINVLLYLGMCIVTSTGLLLYYLLVPGSEGGRGLTFWEMNRHEWGDIHFYASFGVVTLSLLHLFLNGKWIVNMLRQTFSAGGEKKGSGGGIPIILLGLIGVAMMVLPFALGVEGDREDREDREGRRSAPEHDPSTCEDCSESDNEAVARDDRRGRGNTPEHDPATCEDCSDSENEAVARDDRRGRGNTPEHDPATCEDCSGSESDVPERTPEPDPSVDEGGSEEFHLRGRTTVGEAAEMAGVSMERLIREMGFPEGTSADQRIGPLCREAGVEMSDLRAWIDERR